MVRPGRARRARLAATDDVARAQSVTLHTTLGDMKVEVFCDEVPRTAENFLALCASSYYEGTRFHRRGGGAPLPLCVAPRARATPA